MMHQKVDIYAYKFYDLVTIVGENIKNMSLKNLYDI